MTTEDKFHAAVNVIKNLPKNGPYQPSNDLLLRFYCYYKQATEGPCKQSKPAFWEVVKRAKWEAWNGLGTMSKEMAMNNYIDELKRIIETMPYTDNAVDFVEKLGPFYEMVDMPLPLPPKKGSASVPEADVGSGGKPISIKPTTEEDSATPIGEGNGRIPNGVNSARKADPEWNDAQAKVQGNGLHVRESYSEKFYSGTESDEDEFSDPVDNDGDFSDDKLEELSQTNGVSPIEDSGFGESTNERNGEEPSVVLNERKGQAWSFFPFRLGGQSNDDTNGIPKLSNGFESGGNPHRDAGIAEDERNSRSGSSPADGAISRGGGDPTATSSSTSRLYGGNLSHQRPPRIRKGVEGRFSRSSKGDSDSAVMSGGGGRGHGPGGGAGGITDDVNEQIALTLVQLQRDMESVLTRLNTLEALTVAHHNIAQGCMVVQGGNQLAKSSDRSWWPFKNMSFKSVAFFLAWPVFLHAVILLIAAHRSRRLRHKHH